GRQADGSGTMERGAADRAFRPDARCLDLWAWPGGAQSTVVRAEVFSGRTEDAAAELGMMMALLQIQPSSPRKRGPILRALSRVRWLWVPALAALGRDDRGEC